MSGHDENVDWARVSFLRGSGLTASDALAQVRSESAEQGVPIDPPPDAASAAEAALSYEEYQAFHSKKCALGMAIRWVGKHIGDTATRLCDAPSAIAWNVHVWTRHSPANEADFFKVLLSRLLPSRADIDRAADFDDTEDTQRLLDMIERIRGEYQKRADEEDRLRLLAIAKYKQR